MDETKEYLEERRKLANEGWAYSMDQIDILIVSISGGGIYVALEVLKAMSATHDLRSIKVAGCLFASAIIGNIVSQVTGKESNNFCIKVCNHKLEQLKVPVTKRNSDLLQYLSKWEKWYHKATNVLNMLSIILMLAALISLMFYFSFTF